MKFTTKNGLDLHYEMAGAGDQTVIFVHGFSCDGTDWEHQVCSLLDTHRVVTCDLRGHGRSGGTGLSCTIEDLAGDIVAVVDELALTNLVFVGHSLGCRVVLEAHERLAGRVGGLVLIDGSVSGRGNAVAVLERNRRMIQETGFTEFARRTFATMFFDEKHDSLRQRVTERAASLNADFGAALRCNNAIWDAVRMDLALAAVQVPLLAIQSTDFSETMKRVQLVEGQMTAWLRLVEDIVPTARIEIIPGPGHFVMLEAPAAVNALLRDFLKMLPRSCNQ